VVRPGDGDPGTVHFAPQADNGAVVGVTTLLRQARPEDPATAAWRVRGMATAAAVRGTGVGSSLLAAAVAHVAAAGGGVLWRHARLSALAFYSRAVLTVYGAPWDDPALGPHVRMARPVAAAGTRESAQRLSQVSAQVLGGLDPDREPHQPRVDGQR
jgi:GNAT superfamily N-acetyltransferase